MTAKQVACALTSRGAVFCRRRWVVVPNVSWGWGLDYEADLIAVSKNRWADEVEIKVCKYDLRSDRQKPKHGSAGDGGLLDEKIKRFWYAVPTELVAEAGLPEVVSPSYGLIEISQGEHPHSMPRAKVLRRPKPRQQCRQVSPEELLKLMHLGIMRYWDLRFQQNEADEWTSRNATARVVRSDTVVRDS